MSYQSVFSKLLRIALVYVSNILKVEIANPDQQGGRYSDKVEPIFKGRNLSIYITKKPEPMNFQTLN